jgi:tetratricopeptide (TPR) repeat protein
MVVVFVVGFAFLGVGSGGLDLQSLVQDVFGSKGGSSGPSLSGALKEVQKHPREAKAYKQLADAYEKKGLTDQTIAALESYVSLAPRDTTQLHRLAQLELASAVTAQQAYSAAYSRQQADGGGTSLRATQQDPITQAVTARDAQAVQSALSAYTSASSKALTTFKRLARVERNEPNLVLLANVAVQLGDRVTAVAALKQALKIKGVDPATRGEIRHRLAQLQPAPRKSGG